MKAKTDRNPGNARAHRRWRRRHRMHSALVAGASMLFVPHAGRSPAKANPAAVGTAVEPAAGPQIIVTTEFALPAELAYESLIQEAAALHTIDPRLVRAVVRLESGFDSTAVSSAGAQGLMQLMPALADELGVSDPFDPRENVFAGTRYLKALLVDHDGDETLALASYNAGPGAVALYDGVPPFPETERYVRTITGWLAQERAAATENE
jgi:soluble lytic murein transglycosylase-like protein